jgi:mono/diheme cytochrome c family protein
MMFAAFTFASLVANPTLAQQDDVAAGRAEYEVACRGCHGLTGKGDGPMAGFLTITPADLTILAKTNNGQYPFLKVFQIIDGRAVVRAHGDSAMPIWGDRYIVESGASGAEPYKTYSAEPFVRARILELTYYIQSLQQQ